MPYIAAKRIPVQRSGQKVFIEPGEPVPEADHWANPGAYEEQGWIRRVAGESPPPPPPPVPAPPAQSQESPPPSEDDASPDEFSRSSLRKMSKADLTELAESRDILISEESTKAEIIEAILESQG